VVPRLLVPEPIPVANAVNTGGQPQTALDMPHTPELDPQQLCLGHRVASACCFRIACFETRPSRGRRPGCWLASAG
jgi:hypothetical protein